MMAQGGNSREGAMNREEIELTDSSQVHLQKSSGGSLATPLLGLAGITEEKACFLDSRTPGIDLCHQHRPYIANDAG